MSFAVSSPADPSASAFSPSLFSPPISSGKAPLKKREGLKHAQHQQHAQQHQQHQHQQNYYNQQQSSDKINNALL